MTIVVVEPEPVARQRLTLRAVQLTLPQRFRKEDVVQGQVAACPIAAAMVAIAHAKPGLLRQILGQPQRGDYCSKRRQDSDCQFRLHTVLAVRFLRHRQPIRVTPVLYFDGRQPAYAHTPEGPGWPSYIEKAYAIWRGRNSYSRLDQRMGLMPPPGPRKILQDLVGPTDMAHFASNRFYPATGFDSPLSDRIVLRLLRRTQRRPTIAATLTEGAEHFGLISNHAYAVLRYHAHRVQIRNPWGDSSAERWIRMRDFKRAFQAMLQAR